MSHPTQHPQPPQQLRQFFQHIPGTSDYTLTLSGNSTGYPAKCPRAGQYYICERRKLDRGTAALNAGTVFHKVVEIRAKVRDELQRDQLQTETIEHFFLNNPVSDDEWRTSDTLLELTKRYNKKYKNDLIKTVLDSNGFPLVEILFTLPLGKIHLNSIVNIGRNILIRIETLYVQWAGRIDDIVELDHQFFVRDYKTSSMFGPTYFNQFQMLTATIGYVWAARQLLDIPIAGAVIDLAVLRKPTPTGKPFDFDRQRFYYSEAQVEEWHHNTLESINTFVTHLKSDFFPMTGMSEGCTFKYGKCPYFEVCTMPQEVRNEILYSNEYTDVTEKPDDVVE